MMKSGRALLAICLAFALVAYSQGNTFNRIRYTGGTIKTSVKPKEWGNRLTITSTLIRLELRDGRTVEIGPKSVSSLSYGQDAHRRVGTMVALGLVTPVALLGLFHKTREHYVGVQYTDSDGHKQGLLLQAHKKNYRAVILALQSATGVPVSVAEEERKYVAVGTVVAEPGPTEAAEITEPLKEERGSGVILLSSDPKEADVWVDGSLEGKTPAELTLAPGVHTIQVLREGYSGWERKIDVWRDSELRVKADLELSGDVAKKFSAEATELVGNWSGETSEGFPISLTIENVDGKAVVTYVEFTIYMRGLAAQGNHKVFIRSLSAEVIDGKFAGGARGPTEVTGEFLSPSSLSGRLRNSFREPQGYRTAAGKATYTATKKQGERIIE